MTKPLQTVSYGCERIFARTFYFIKSEKCILILAICIFSFSNSFAQVGISSTSITPDASSILELRSTSAGFLSPRMTTAQRDAITSPAAGLLIFNTSTSQLNYYTGSSWQLVAGGTDVTSVSVTTANGVSGTVANATTTPAISLTLGAITLLQLRQPVPLQALIYPEQIQEIKLLLQEMQAAPH